MNDIVVFVASGAGVVFGLLSMALHARAARRRRGRKRG